MDVPLLDELEVDVACERVFESVEAELNELACALLAQLDAYET